MHRRAVRSLRSHCCSNFSHWPWWTFRARSDQCVACGHGVIEGAADGCDCLLMVVPNDARQGGEIDVSLDADGSGCDIGQIALPYSLRDRLVRKRQLAAGVFLLFG